jgi:DnaJ-class molecular chaperone
MSNPYVTLGLSVEADQTRIRQRYLELVREFPPDRAPERFAEIREAYNQLCDPVKWMKSRLFEMHRNDSTAQIQWEVQQRIRAARIPTQALLDLADLA